MDVTRIEVDFEPRFTIRLPAVDRFTGKIEVMLPEHHYKFYDLSMGGILPGAHIGADGRGWGLTLDVGEDGMDVGDMVRWLHASEDALKALHKAVQDELDKTYLLGRSGR